MNGKKDKAVKRSEHANKTKKIPISAEDFLRKIGRMYSEYATEDIGCHMEPDIETCLFVERSKNGLIAKMDMMPKDFYKLVP